MRRSASVAPPPPSANWRATSAAPRPIRDPGAAIRQLRRSVMRQEFSSDAEFLSAMPQSARRRHLPRQPARFLDVAAEERTRRELRKLVTYEPPSAEVFSDMRWRLLLVSDKLNLHRTLVDRFAGVDLNPRPSVPDRINEKYLQLVFRMPELERNCNPGHARIADDYVAGDFLRRRLHESRGHAATPPPPVSELRGKIRRLISKNKRVD